MAADIVLNDDSVEVVDGTFRVHGLLLGMGQDGGRWLRATLQAPQPRTPKGTAELEIGSGTQSGATVHVWGEDGSTSVSSSGISTTTVTGRRSVNSVRGEFGEVVADEVTIGHGARYSEGPRAGMVDVKSAAGESTIVLDGAAGDITLSTIGSLVAKIDDLQRQIDQLRG